MVRLFSLVQTRGNLAPEMETPQSVKPRKPYAFKLHQQDNEQFIAACEKLGIAPISSAKEKVMALVKAVLAETPIKPPIVEEKPPVHPILKTVETPINTVVKPQLSKEETAAKPTVSIPQPPQPVKQEPANVVKPENPNKTKEETGKVISLELTETINKTFQKRKRKGLSESIPQMINQSINYLSKNPTGTLFTGRW